MSLKGRPMVMLTAIIKVVTSLEEKTYNAQLPFCAFLGEISPWKTSYVFIKALANRVSCPLPTSPPSLLSVHPSALWVSSSLFISLPRAFQLLSGPCKPPCLSSGPNASPNPVTGRQDQELSTSFPMRSQWKKRVL